MAFGLGFHIISAPSFASQAVFFRRRHQPRRPPLARSTLVKSEKLKTSTSVRLAAESGQKPASAWRVWQPEHTSEEIQEGGKKGQSRRELSERLHVGRSEMFGGLSSEHFWINGAATAGRYEGRLARKRPCHSDGCRTVG